MPRRPLVLAVALLVASTAALAGPTYQWKTHRFRTVPLVTVERLGRFLLGVFPFTTDGLGEKLSQSTWWLGPQTGSASLVEHTYVAKEAPVTDLMVFRETEPLPTLLGTVRLPGEGATLVDLDGDAVPEVLYQMSVDRVLKKASFSLKQYPSVDVVLAWDGTEQRFVLANEAHRVFLGTRLGPAYDALRRDAPDDRLPGAIQLAFYFFGTGQPDEGRTLLARHVDDPAERAALEKAFTAIAAAPWLPPCGCPTGYECHPQARLCEPRGVDTTWKEWPKRVTVTPDALTLSAGSGQRNFWDEDGTPPYPFVEMAVDGGEPQRSPRASDTLEASWNWKATVDLYPLTELRVTVKDDDGAFAQVVAMKALSAKELLEKALANGGDVELKLRNVRRLILKVAEILPEAP